MKHSDEIKNVTKKLSLAMADMDSHAKKDRQHGHFHFKYTSIAQYISHVRPAVVKHGLVIVPSVVNRVDHGNGLTDVVMEYTIIDSDSGEYISASFEGRGHDPKDKGVYKAYSGAYKYFLQQFFLIASGSPEPEDHKPPKKQLKKVTPIPPKPPIIEKPPPPKNGHKEYIARINTMQKEIKNADYAVLTNFPENMYELSIKELTAIGLSLKAELEQIKTDYIEDIQSLAQEIRTAGGDFDVPLLLERNTCQELHKILKNMQTYQESLDTLAF